MAIEELWSWNKQLWHRTWKILIADPAAEVSGETKKKVKRVFQVIGNFLFLIVLIAYYTKGAIYLYSLYAREIGQVGELALDKLNVPAILIIVLSLLLAISASLYSVVFFKKLVDDYGLLKYALLFEGFLKLAFDIPSEDLVIFKALHWMKEFLNLSPKAAQAVLELGEQICLV